MKLLKRDTHYHTYADYLTWSATYGDELINGSAYVREPPAPSHQWIVGELHRQIANALKGNPCRVCVAPFDIRLPKSTEEDDQIDTVVQPALSLYRLEAGHYGRATLLGLKGQTPLTAVPGVTIDWNQVLAEIL